MVVKKKSTCFVLLFLALATASPAVSADRIPEHGRPERKAQFSEPLLGAWQEEGGKTLMNVEPGRITLFDGAALTFRGLIRLAEEDSLILRNDGVKEVWKAALQKDGRLKVENGSRLLYFHKLDNVPSTVRLEPMPLGPAGPLPADRVRAIQEEIARRFHHEQELLRDQEKRGGYSAAVAENLQYLVDLIREIGWIDADRFGSQTSVYATIISKHSNDLRLMMTVLPFAETAFRDSGDGQTYAVLYDAFHLRIGDPQRYGTQVAEDEHGNPYLLPVENDDLEAVNERLRSMGIPPLEKYLADLRDLLYPGKEVRIAKEEAY